MSKKTKDKSIPAKDVFKKRGGDDNKISSSPAPEMPAEKEFAEAHTPELSTDTFQIADKTFQLRASNIKTQKVMAHALDVITDLIKKIDLLPIFKGIQDKLNKNADSPSGGNEYLDIIEMIKDVIEYGGVGNIMGAILDLYVGVVFAICKGQYGDVTRDWIEENMSFYDAQRIFFIQMNKDRIGGRVIDFLHMLTQQIVSGVETEKTN